MYRGISRKRLMGLHGTTARRRYARRFTAGINHAGLHTFTLNKGTYEHPSCINQQEHGLQAYREGGIKTIPLATLDTVAFLSFNKLTEKRLKHKCTHARARARPGRVESLALVQSVNHALPHADLKQPFEKESTNGRHQR